MILSANDTLHAYEKLMEGFSKSDRIDDYFRKKKMERLREMPPTLFGYGWEDELFDDFSMHPRDMDFYMEKVSQTSFKSVFEITSSFVYSSSPGRTMHFFVREKNTKKIVGLIKLASPMLVARPRNQWLGEVPDFKRYNNHAMMGMVIVPTQPFGFNYLGGKLLSLFCCSHESREMFSKQYGIDICIFETTSLYGNIKGTSQYDGLKPYVRHVGDTLSDFVPMLPDYLWHYLNKWFTEKNGGVPVYESHINQKLMTHMKFVSIIRNSIKNHFPDRLDEYDQFIVKSKEITPKKRFYVSDCGFSNAKEVALGKQDTLLPNPVNYDKFYMANLIEWWKGKASKRYEKLVAEKYVRNDLEVWNEDTINSIDIIR